MLHFSERARAIAKRTMVFAYFGVMAFFTLRAGGVPGVLSPFYVGRWHRTGGKAEQPMELNIRFHDNQVQFRSRDEHWGVDTITFRCDGDEHLYRREIDGKTTYRAHCDSYSIAITKHSENWAEHYIYDESWTATNRGRHLTYKRDNLTATYDRFSLWHRFATNAP